MAMTFYVNNTSRCQINYIISMFVFSSFNVLSVALANEMLTMIVDLLENARKESSSDQLMKLIDFESEIIPAPLDICSKAKACGRLLRIFQTVPLIKFFYQLAAISHRKVIVTHIYIFFFENIISSFYFKKILN